MTVSSPGRAIGLGESSSGELRKRWLLGFSLLAALLLVSHSLIAHVIASQIESSAQLELARRQSMLAQRSGRLSLQLMALDEADGDENTRRALEAALAILVAVHRSYVGSLDALAHAAEIGSGRADRARLERQVGNLEGAAHSLLTAGPEHLDAARLELQSILSSTSSSLSHAFEAWAGRVEARVARRLRIVQRISALLVVIEVTVLALVALLLLEPAFKRVWRRIFLLEAANVELRRLSSLDPLTGLANRRAFEEALQREWRRAFREDASIALAMADIDHFKAYNDRWGHRAGDECLRRIASVLRRALERPADLAARHGGEEFAVLLPATDGAGAAVVAERVRSGVEALALEHPSAAVGGRVTVSLGVAAALPFRGSSPKELVEAADRALYAAKRGGRNRVTIVDSLQPREIESRHRTGESDRPASLRA